MIKVIAHGLKRICTCDKCGSKLIYEKEDVKHVQVGMNEYDYEIQCPDCGEKVNVPYI